MKKQINVTIKAHLFRSTFILLPLLAVCVIPFALGQRDASNRNEAVGRSQLPPLSSLGSLSRPFGGPGVLSPNLSPWSIVANYPLVSESVSVSSDGRFAYGAGGIDGVNFVPTNSFNRYDPVANSWIPLANVPTAFYDAPSVYAANTNSIYIFGGIDPNILVLNTTQIYNVGAGTWTTGAPMPDPNGRYFASAAYYSGNGKIYVIGGFDGATFSEQSQTWEYDPVANTWNTSRASIPVAMGGAGFSIVGQNIYLAGHWNGGAASTDHYRYDIVADSWSAMAPVPVPIYRPDAAGIGTNTYLVGGGNPFFGAGSKDREAPKLAPHPSMRAPAVSYTSTYIYDTLANSWTTGPNTNVAHSFTGGTAIGTQLIVVTGYDGVGDTNTVEMADAGGGGTLCQFQVLIVYADDTGVPTQLQSQILAEAGVTAADLFDATSSTPPLAQLQQYNIVVPFSNSPFLDGDTLGNNLADYVDGGGIVVQYGFAHYGPFEPYGINGRWVSSGYNAYDYSTNLEFNSFSLGTFNAGHPLMAGVTTLDSNFANIVTPNAAATEVAQNNFGESLVAFRPVSGGHTTVGVTAYVGASATQSGDWGRVVVNAGNWLLNCGGGELTLESSFSRKTDRHNSFDIPLPGVEDRSDNKRFVIGFTFNNDVTGADSASTSCGTIGSVSVDPNDSTTLLVTFNGQTCNQQNVTVTAINVHDTMGNTLASAETSGCFLIGDVNGDGRVGNGDIGSIQGHLGEGTDSSNFRNDINADGRINNQDVQAARSHRRESCQ